MDAPQSKQAGLYGDSMYPPMFDDEPPPFDDDDNDDDGFADFGAFQTTGSLNSDSNWSSWSNATSTEIKKPIAGNDDDFGDFNQAFGGPKKEENKGIVVNGIAANRSEVFSTKIEDGDAFVDSKIEQHQVVKSVLGDAANLETEQSFQTYLKHGKNDNDDGFGEFGSFAKVEKDTDPAKHVVSSGKDNQSEHTVSPATVDARMESGIISDSTSVLSENSNIDHKSSTFGNLQTLSKKSDDLNSESFASFEKSDSSEIYSNFASFSNDDSFDKFEENMDETNGESNGKSKLWIEHSIDNDKSLKISSELQSNPDAGENTTERTASYLFESTDDSFDKKDDFQDFSYVSKSITGRHNTDSFTQNEQESSLDREMVLKSGNALIENKNSEMDSHEDDVEIEKTHCNGTLDNGEQEDDCSFRTGEFASFSNDSTEDKNRTSMDNDDSWASFSTSEKDNKFAPKFENDLVGPTDYPNENIDTSTTTTKNKPNGDESFASFDQSLSKKDESFSSRDAENLQFESMTENQNGKDMSNDDEFDNYKDFSSVKPALNISSKILTDSRIDGESDFEEFESFSKIEKTEQSFETSLAAAVSSKSAGTVASSSLTETPLEITPPSEEFIDGKSNDNFADFGTFSTSEKSSLDVVPDTAESDTDFKFQDKEQPPVDMESEDFGDFGAFNKSEMSKTQFEVAPTKTENREDLDLKNEEKLNVNKESDDFGDFGAFGSSESGSAFGDPAQSAESNIQNSENKPPSIIGQENDEFGNFGSFATSESFPATFSKASDGNIDSESKDSDWAQFSMSKEGSGNSNKEDINEDFDDFAAFPSEQKNSDLKDDGWASFSSQSPAKDSKPVIAKTGDFGSFGRPPVVKEKQIQSVPSKGLSSKVGLLVSACFSQSSQQSVAIQPTGNGNLDSYIDDDRNQGSSCVWSKLTDDAQVDDVWNLSYMSSTSFKWLLLTMNVTFEHIIKKWKHPSKDTQSSLSPTSSVASFDVETASEPIGILIPEPAVRLNSLLKPTLLAQSQQKELNLQRVPSMSSLKKGDSGSDTTSETASLDLEFFSGAISMQPSLQTQLTKDSSTSLNSMDLHDIDLASEPTASAGDVPPVKRGPTAHQVGSQSEGKAQSLPFNLDALSKAASKSEISSEAKKFLSNLESLRFMNSTVLMFPSQFSGDE